MAVAGPLKFLIVSDSSSSSAALNYGCYLKQAGGPKAVASILFWWFYLNDPMGGCSGFGFN